MNNKIKLLILVDELVGIGGGAERQIYELLMRINREKFEVFLYLVHHKDAPKEIKDTGCSINGTGINRIYGLRGIWEGFKFTSFLKKEKIDILMTYHFDLLLALLGQKKNKGSPLFGTDFAC